MAAAQPAADGHFVVFPIIVVFSCPQHISNAGVVGEFVGLKNFAAAVTNPAFPPSWPIPVFGWWPW